jgi:hypothetical protein
MSLIAPVLDSAQAAGVNHVPFFSLIRTAYDLNALQIIVIFVFIRSSLTAGRLGLERSHTYVPRPSRSKKNHRGSRRPMVFKSLG